MEPGEAYIHARKAVKDRIIAMLHDQFRAGQLTGHPLQEPDQSLTLRRAEEILSLLNLLGGIRRGD